ncbi:hypothetical protein P3T16_006972, partial [Paraburkholderia sp. GAS42]
QFVVSGGYAASDSSLPAKMNVGTPDEIIVAPHVSPLREAGHCPLSL